MMLLLVASSLLLALASQSTAQLAPESGLKEGNSTSALSVNQPGEPPASSSSSESRLANKQTAPYAREHQEDGAGSKNLILHLTLNQTSEGNGFGLTRDTNQRWRLTSQNGSTLEGAGGVELQKLLTMLNSSKLSSELQIDHLEPGLVNISILNWRAEGQNREDDARELSLLEDLLNESKLEPALNRSAELRNNHRLIARHPVRSKPLEVGLVVSSMTVPPIRRTLEVVAENYTSKKIANEANIFALRLLEQLNMEQLGAGNIINSPFSIYQGLGLLMLGSMGDTSRELDKLLLSLQSVYENTKLTHDQDRSRLLASFGDVIRQLQGSATNHFQRSTLEQDEAKRATVCADKLSGECYKLSQAPDRLQYGGGSQEQHFIVANNLLFSPGAYEISNEFRALLNAYHNNTALTKMEVGSSESVQLVNGWIRQATAGMIPGLISRRNTFDEFNVMTMLSTSWLAQEWRHSFRRVASPLRSNVRLKGQGAGRAANRILLQPALAPDEPLMEFVDDRKGSHFVEYIQSRPTRSIHNYHTYLNRQLVDVVLVPFRNSNQRLVALTPLPMATDGFRAKNLALNATLDPLAADPSNEPAGQQAPAESSRLSKLISALASEPRKAIRQLWATIAPEIITKQTVQSMQPLASLHNSTVESRNLPIPPMVQLSMPTLRLEADSSLSAPLNHIGLVNAFDASQANFIGINGHPFNDNKLHLSNVVYKTTFNLNANGINYDRTVRTLESMRVLAKGQQAGDHMEEADKLEPGELVNQVRLDKPFMLMVVDMRSKLILYAGVVRNPAK